MSYKITDLPFPYRRDLYVICQQDVNTVYSPNIAASFVMMFIKLDIIDEDKL
jgi:hypothetical protein